MTTTLPSQSVYTLINQANTKPMNSKELDELAKISVLETIEKEVLAKALISPPFILLESNEKASESNSTTILPVACLNFRDCSSESRTPQIRSKLIYRAGKSSFNGHSLRKLGIGRVYDLRGQFECQRDPHADENVMQGIQIRWFPPRDHLSIVEQVQQGGEEENDGNETTSIQYVLAKSYLTILFSHQEIFRQILLDLVNSPPPPSSDACSILIHCTAGKDRTGVAIAMLHSLAGCSNEGIAADYALTRIGVEPARLHLLNAIQASIPNFSLDDPRFLASSESKAEVMILFLQLVQQRFSNGFEGYAGEVLGLTEQEIMIVKEHLRAC